jgi:hypothetical protein
MKNQLFKPKEIYFITERLPKFNNDNLILILVVDTNF